jgi:hypothetical protein
MLSSVLPIVVLIFAIIHPRLTLSRMLSFTALVLAVTFAMLPRIIFGSAYADMRLVPYLFAIALLAIRFRDAPDKATAQVLAYAAMAFLLARTASVTWSLAIASNEQRRYLAEPDGRQLPGPRLADVAQRPYRRAGDRAPPRPGQQPLGESRRQAADQQISSGR